MHCTTDGPGLAGRRREDPPALRPKRDTLASFSPMARTPPSPWEAEATKLVPVVAAWGATGRPRSSALAFTGRPALAPPPCGGSPSGNAAAPWPADGRRPGANAARKGIRSARRSAAPPRTEHTRKVRS